MLQRIAPSLFQGTTGETVTIAAVAQGNNGVEAATFRYGTTRPSFGDRPMLKRASLAALT